MTKQINTPDSYYAYLTRRGGFRRLARRFFMKDLARHIFGKVLDVGCGAGEFMNQYTESVGVDINPRLVKHCLAQGLECYIADAHSLPFPDCCFDSVLASNILEHLEAVETGMSEAARVLRPGGILTATVPMDAGFHHDPSHVHMLRESDLRAIAQRIGLTVTAIYRFPFRSDWPGRFLYFCELRAIFVKSIHDGASSYRTH